MPALRHLVVLTSAVLFGCGGNSQGGPDAPASACADLVDNDGDGTIDFPDDLGCSNESDETEDSPTQPQCSDGRDNDGDGKFDYPNDPGCSVPNADGETDDCPGGPACPQCADGIDNDGNGASDYPDDSLGCMAAGDNVEFTDNPVACGTGVPIAPLPTNGIASGTLSGTSSMVSSPCGGGNGTPANAYVLHIATPTVMVATTEDAMTVVDTVLDIRSSACSDAGAEMACHDNITATNKASKLTASLGIGTYYLIVYGKTTSDIGTYGLTVEFFPGAGTPCTVPEDCGPGLLCRIPMGSTSMVCAGPVCNDGIDDDGDTKADYPLDPGCASPTDDTEDDTCPAGPTCPACSNGIDDDLDGSTDYPNDPSCVAASMISESCAQSEPVIIATTALTTGTTVGAINDFRPPPGSFNGHLCSTTATHTAPDVAVQFDIPAMTSMSLRLSPVGFDSSQVLFDASCTGTPIDCYDSPTGMVVTNLAAGRHFLIVDGYSTAAGTFTLNLAGTIMNGESCESPLAQSGAITCAVGYGCSGTPGSRICAPTQCNDGVDNNGNGVMDFPADPGCVSVGDLTEDTVCPGPSCPACSDGLDNDGDTLIDYPLDTGCVTAAGTNEGCGDSDPIVAVTSPVTTGTLVGATDDHDPKCVTTNLPDKVFTLDIPSQLQSLVIDTEGSAVDTVLSLMDSTCGEPSIACDDDAGVGVGDSLISRGNTSPGSYTIAVDSDSTTLDTFILNVKGTIIPGGRCGGALFQAGVLVCPPAFGCNGPAGAQTCSAAQCLDGVDNDGNGTADYPNDPACDSPSDNTETTVCPGPSCPACADGIDNDLDGKTDFPTDPGCSSAAETNEGCTDSDAIAPITMPTTTGTLVGTVDDHHASCVTTNGADLIYTLTVPNLDTLTIDTEGSTVDTALSLMGSDCTEPALVCDDDGGIGTGDSLITRSFVLGGTYTIAVDADTTVPSTFNLNVHGTILPGSSCESPLLAAGVLTCTLGFACDGPVGARTCQVSQCLDGLDNNGDGHTDFPSDPGCDSFSDDTETTVCPGATCPICSDGLDNDGDGDIDYPADASCSSAAAMNEACTQSEPVGAITQMVTTGNTAGQVNDYMPTCASSTHAAPDLAYELDLPAMDTLTLNLTGFDTAHTLLDSTCGATPPIACSDPAVMTRTMVPAGTYYLIIDGWSTASGPWSLTTTGTISSGGSCEGALFQTGAFICATGTTCSGTPGTRTCVP